MELFTIILIIVNLVLLASNIWDRISLRKLRTDLEAHKPIAWIKLWQHKDNGRITAATSQPSRDWFEIPTIFEDNLPKDISETMLDWWYERSFIDAVRRGPKI